MVRGQYQGRFPRAVASAVAILLAVAILVPSLKAAPLELPFEIDSRHDAILLSAELNGKPVTLLLDTGSTYTILDAHLLGLTNLDLKTSRFSDSGPGLHGEAVWAAARLRLGARIWREQRVVAMNLAPLASRYGRPIHGILGQDILRQFDRVTIDFRARTLVLSSGKEHASNRVK